MRLTQKSYNIIDVGSRLHHCSSVCVTDDGVYIAGYCNPECTDMQRVFVLFEPHYGNKPSKYPFNQFSNALGGRTIMFENCTGNPLLIKNSDGGCDLIYSKFQDINYGCSPVKRWMCCDNYITKIKYDDGAFNVDRAKKLENLDGLLCRSAPLYHKNKTYIPLYREKDPQCYMGLYNTESMTIDIGRPFAKNVDFKGYLLGYNELYTTSGLGHGVAIQPTFAAYDDKIVCYMRNCAKPTFVHDRKLWVCESYDDGKTWGNYKETDVSNQSTSVVCMNDINPDWILTSSDWRVDMNIRDMGTHEYIMELSNPNDGVPQNLRSKESYSYPNYFYDKNNSDLHIVFTNNKLISYYVFMIH